MNESLTLTICGPSSECPESCYPGHKHWSWVGGKPGERAPQATPLGTEVLSPSCQAPLLQIWAPNLDFETAFLLDPQLSLNPPPPCQNQIL